MLLCLDTSVKDLFINGFHENCHNHKKSCCMKNDLLVTIHTIIQQDMQLLLFLDIKDHQSTCSDIQSNAKMEFNNKLY